MIEKYDKKLTVQTKILKVTDMEDSNQVWKRESCRASMLGKCHFSWEQGLTPSLPHSTLDVTDWEQVPAVHFVAKRNLQFTTSFQTGLRYYSKEGILGGMIVAQ